MSDVKNNKQQPGIENYTEVKNESSHFFTKILDIYSNIKNQIQRLEPINLSEKYIKNSVSNHFQASINELKEEKIDIKPFVKSEDENLSQNSIANIVKFPENRVTFHDYSDSVLVGCYYASLTAVVFSITFPHGAILSNRFPDELKRRKVGFAAAISIAIIVGISTTILQNNTNSIIYDTLIKNTDNSSVTEV